MEPEDLEEEELAAYAEEYDLHLEDIPIDDIFSLSDLEDYPPGNTNDVRESNGTLEDVEMDM